MREAAFYEKKDEHIVRCFLCPHHCIIKPDKTGVCGVRRNAGGSLFSLNYGRISSVHMDPVEKKPLYHFYPGSLILSLGTLGCNFSCSFCQNASISQIPKKEVDYCFKAMTTEITPAEVVRIAKETVVEGNIGVAYTYNEPSIWYEFVLESSKEVKKAGLKNVLVTNGYLEIEPLREILPFIDAVNVDIKSIEDSFYRKLCGGTLAPVLEYCKTAKEKTHVEITNLLVTGENDSDDIIERLVDWVSVNLGRDTPLHFSRYHPDYHFEAPATSGEILSKAFEIGSKKLDYVYVGNVLNPHWSATRCPSCGKTVIERPGMATSEIYLTPESRCKFCGAGVSVIV